jgi:A/G-specific adenine glycosylase
MKGMANFMQGNIPQEKQPSRTRIQLNPKRRRWFRRRLLNWYSSNQRHLPWRKTKDPYRIWISEVMLQQTQVLTVVPYYLDFLKVYPTIKHLAEANTQQLLRIWAGLGYYSRARNLHQAALKIVHFHGGKFPETYPELVSLPGIGRYTAGAILSIAFDLPYPVLDGNVVRVLTRLFALRGDPKGTELQRVLWKYAEKLVPAKSPGDFNQALMELGATVCSPRQPRCLLCPWQTECLARREGVQELFPEKSKVPVVERSSSAVAVVFRRKCVLIVRRSQGRLFRDFWEFPGGEFNGVRNIRSALATKIKNDLGLRIRVLDLLATIKHSVTQHRITLQAYRAELQTSTAVDPRRSTARWVKPAELRKYPFASASSQIVELLQSRG